MSATSTAIEYEKVFCIIHKNHVDMEGAAMINLLRHKPYFVK